MSIKMRLPQALKDRDVFGFFEDFESNYVTGDRWTPLTSDSSDAAAKVLVSASAPGGILSITQDATDNDEIYFGLTKLAFKMAANKPCYFECRSQYSEGNTNANNVMMGWGSAATFAANGLIDDGGGPVATATMAVVYKLDGGTVWRCRSQIGAAVGQTDSVSTNTAGGSAYQVIGVLVEPYSSTKAKITYTIDGNPFYDANGKAITHDLTFTNAAAMSPIFCVKTGSATAEVNLCDYIAAYQAR